MTGRESAREVELAFEATAAVGEGPLWDEALGRLLWVDIPAGELHSWSPTDGAEEVKRTGTLLGAVAVRASGGLVAAVADGFATLARDGAATVLAPVSGAPRLRMNDAKCDPAGRFWGGSTALTAVAGAGALHCWDGRSSWTAWEGMTLPNGLGWSPDGTVIYVADSGDGVVWSAPFDVETGTLGRRAPLIEIAPAEGVPDGLCVDADGCLWMALWGGGEVRRLAPDGRLLERVAMPVSQPSSCAIAPGGTLYVTSARAGLGAAALAREPLAGSLFAAAVGCEPVPVATFSG